MRISGVEIRHTGGLTSPNIMSHKLKKTLFDCAPFEQEPFGEQGQVFVRFIPALQGNKLWFLPSPDPDPALTCFKLWFRKGDGDCDEALTPLVERALKLLSMVPAMSGNFLYRLSKHIGLRGLRVEFCLTSTLSERSFTLEEAWGQALDKFGYDRSHLLAVLRSIKKSEDILVYPHLAPK